MPSVRAPATNGTHSIERRPKRSASRTSSGSPVRITIAGPCGASGASGKVAGTDTRCASVPSRSAMSNAHQVASPGTSSSATRLSVSWRCSPRSRISPTRASRLSRASDWRSYSSVPPLTSLVSLAYTVAGVPSCA